MDPTTLHEKLIQAARRDTPSDHVPYAFSQRVMSRLAPAPAPVDQLGYWAQSLWRAVAPCAAVAMLLVAWTLLGSEAVGGTEEFAQHFENTVLAAGADIISD
jgi:hypothetical protein